MRHTIYHFYFCTLSLVSWMQDMLLLVDPPANIVSFIQASKASVVLAFEHVHAASPTVSLQ